MSLALVAWILAEGVPATDVAFGRLLFNREIKAGDLLTPISVVLALATFAWTLRKDIQSRQSAEADRLRAAAAKALGKLQRWKELALWYYNDVQPAFVEISDLLAAEFDPAKARDRLWMILSASRMKSAERLLDESLETAYVELASYYPGIYAPFRAAIHAMKTIDDERHIDHLGLCQAAVLSYGGRRQGYVPPMLGNDLRACTNAITALFSEQLAAASGPIEAFLTSIINQTDRELLEGKRVPARIPNPPARYPSVREVAATKAEAAQA